MSSSHHSGCLDTSCCWCLLSLRSFLLSQLSHRFYDVSCTTAILWQGNSYLIAIQKLSDSLLMAYRWLTDISPTVFLAMFASWKHSITAIWSVLLPCCTAWISVCHCDTVCVMAKSHKVDEEKVCCDCYWPSDVCLPSNVGPMTLILLML